jgi:hypothetical protein
MRCQRPLRNRLKTSGGCGPDVPRRIDGERCDPPEGIPSALAVAHEPAAREHTRAAPSVSDPQLAIREGEQRGDGQRWQGDTSWRLDRARTSRRRTGTVLSWRRSTTCRLRTVRGRIRCLGAPHRMVHTVLIELADRRKWDTLALERGRCGRDDRARECGVHTSGRHDADSTSRRAPTTPPMAPAVTKPPLQARHSPARTHGGARLGHLVPVAPLVRRPSLSRDIFVPLSSASKARSFQPCRRGTFDCWRLSIPDGNPILVANTARDADSAFAGAWRVSVFSLAYEMQR